MKTPPSNFDPRWDKLLQRARPDVPPAADVAALHRVVREAQAVAPKGWAAEVFAFFESSRLLPWCGVGACIFTLVATWEAWDWWQTLPWVAQLLAMTTGGLS